MEELNEEVVAEVEETNLDFVEAPENDLAEAAEAEAEVDDMSADLDEAVDTKETLETIHDEMGKTVEEGGMSEPEARALEVAVEHLCANIGFSRARKTFPAMEGFADKKDRAHATKVAMEGVADKAKAIGESIMVVIRKILEAIKTFFQSLFNAAVGLKKRANALATKAEGMKDAHAADAKIKAGSFVETLEVNGSFKPDSLTANYKTHVANALLKEDRLAKLKEIATVLELSFAGKDSGPAEEKMGILMGGLTTGTPTTNKALDLQKGDKATELALTFGQKSYYVVANSEASNYKAFIGSSTDAKAVAEVKEVAPLHGQDVAELAKAVSAHLTSYTEAQAKVKIATSTLDDLVNKIKGAVGKENVEMNKVQAIIRGAITLTTGTSKIVRGYDIRVNKAVLDVCAASLAAYGAKKEAKAADAAPADAAAAAA